MKTLRLFAILFLLVSGTQLMSQIKTLPGIDIYSLEGNRINTSQICGKNETVVLFFWRIADQKSLDQLAILNEGYEQMITGKSMKIIGICTDSPGTFTDVKPLLNGKEISLDVYIDLNNDLKRALNVPETPYTMILDSTHGNDFRITGFCPDIVNIITDRIDNRLVSLSDK